MLATMRGEMVVDQELTKLPKHIGFIIDGNGRWAQQRGWTRTKGHEYGIKSLDVVLHECFYHYAIPIVSVYAFSTENWHRPKVEINFLFKALTNYLQSGDFQKKFPNVKVNIMGDYTKFPAKLSKSAAKIMADTKDETPFLLNFGINYSGKDELVYAVNRIIRDQVPQVDRETIEKYLYTHGQPPLDLVVRTSGEQRLSNFMLWQVAYAELYFPKTYWPDFDQAALLTALQEYQQRDRRFGAIKKRGKQS